MSDFVKQGNVSNTWTKQSETGQRVGWGTGRWGEMPWGGGVVDEDIWRNKQPVSSTWTGQNNT